MLDFEASSALGASGKGALTIHSGSSPDHHHMLPSQIHLTAPGAVGARASTVLYESNQRSLASYRSSVVTTQVPQFSKCFSSPSKIP